MTEERNLSSATSLTLEALDRMIESVEEDIKHQDPGNYATIGALCGEGKGLRAARTYLQQAIARSERTNVDEEVINFLLGSAPLDGHWFGEKPLEKPMYWWRDRLKAMLGQPKLVYDKDSRTIVQQERGDKEWECICPVGMVDPECPKCMPKPSRCTNTRDGTPDGFEAWFAEYSSTGHEELDGQRKRFKDIAHQAWKAAKSARWSPEGTSSSTAQLPKGVKALPRFPTIAMSEAGAKAYFDALGDRAKTTYASAAASIYHAMFDAAASADSFSASSNRPNTMLLIKRLKDQRDALADAMAWGELVEALARVSDRRES